jgi:hypothetical protein
MRPFLSSLAGRVVLKRMHPHTKVRGYFHRVPGGTAHAWAHQPCTEVLGFYLRLVPPGRNSFLTISRHFVLGYFRHLRANL